MKTILLFIGLSFMSISESFAQNTIYSCLWLAEAPFPLVDFNNRDTVSKYFYFDTLQTNNIWQLGVPAKTTFDSAYSKPLALVTDTLHPYPINNTSSFSITVNTLDCNVGEISFWHRFNTDSLSDGGVIEYSIDSGSTWKNVIDSPFTSYNFYVSTDSIASNGNKPGFTGTRDWTYSRFSFGFLPQQVEFKFTFTSDGTNSNKDGWMIDDLLIWTGEFTGIAESKNNSSVQIFPNPASDHISIKLDNATQFKSATLTDIVGKTILETDKTTIDLSQLEEGIYFATVTTDKGKYVGRVLREKSGR